MNDINTARLTQSYGLTRPSQPNYIMMYSGTPQGVTSNNLPAPLPFTTPNLGAAMIKTGKSFIGYSEDLPSTGYSGEVSGAYARKHNPWVNWQEASQNGIPISSNAPFSNFPTDFNLLPTLSIVVPNQNNDMHDGTIAAGDAWIQNNMNAYIQWCKLHNSLFILTFDEDDRSANNHILTLFTGANINGGSYNQPITHYNLLRTVEELYQLPFAGVSNDSAAIQNIWTSTLPLHVTKFEGRIQASEIVLHWETTEDQNSKAFLIERLTNNTQGWVKLANIPARLNSNSNRYTYTDVMPVNGLNQYRLKMIDLYGDFMYSKIIGVRVEEKNMLVYPNPSTGIIYIQPPVNCSGPCMLSVIDVTGKLMCKKLVQDMRSTFILDVSGFKKGMYYILFSENQQVKRNIMLIH